MTKEKANSSLRIASRCIAWLGTCSLGQEIKLDAWLVGEPRRGAGVFLRLLSLQRPVDLDVLRAWLLSSGSKFHTNFDTWWRLSTKRGMVESILLDEFSLLLEQQQKNDTIRFITNKTKNRDSILPLFFLKIYTSTTITTKKHQKKITKGSRGIGVMKIKVVFCIGAPWCHGLSSASVILDVCYWINMCENKTIRVWT